MSSQYYRRWCPCYSGRFCYYGVNAGWGLNCRFTYRLQRSYSRRPLCHLSSTELFVHLLAPYYWLLCCALVTTSVHSHEDYYNLPVVNLFNCTLPGSLAHSHLQHHLPVCHSVSGLTLSAHRLYPSFVTGYFGKFHSLVTMLELVPESAFHFELHQLNGPTCDFCHVHLNQRHCHHFHSYELSSTWDCYSGLCSSCDSMEVTMAVTRYAEV